MWTVKGAFILSAIFLKKKKKKKENGSGTHRVTQNSIGGWGEFFSRNCTKSNELLAVTRWNFNGLYVSLLERRAVGQQDTPNLVISIAAKKSFRNGVPARSATKIPLNILIGLRKVSARTAESLIFSIRYRCITVLQMQVKYLQVYDAIQTASSLCPQVEMLGVNSAYFMFFITVVLHTYSLLCTVYSLR
jgi:hypothetical protein